MKRRALALSLMWLAALHTPLHAQGTPKLLTSWETPFANGIALDESGNVYVLGDVIYKYTGDGASLGTIGKPGLGAGEVDFPAGLFIAADGRLYIADTGNDRVQILTAEGDFIEAWGTAGRLDGSFVTPQDIVLDESGNAYVADTGNFRMQKFDGDGDVVQTWGNERSDTGQELNHPTGVALGEDDVVYVVDEFFDKVQKFANDGTHIASWGTHGSGAGQFMAPRRIAVGATAVYVVDTGNNRIQVFTSGGEFLYDWSGFKQVDDIKLDGKGHAYIADSGCSCVLKYELTEPTSATWGRVRDIWR